MAGAKAGVVFSEVKEVSYDVWLEIDTGNGHVATVDECLNCTSNMAPFWRAFGADLAEMDGRLAGDCKHALDDALAKMTSASREERAKYEPSNGWGSTEGAIHFITRIRDLCGRHPACRLVVCR